MRVLNMDSAGSRAPCRFALLGLSAAAALCFLTPRTHASDAQPPAAKPAIPLQKLQEIKNATVFITVQAASFTTTGTGFLFAVNGDTGYVVTNDHVANNFT